MSDPFLDRMEAFDEVQSQRNLTVRHESEVLAAQANVAAARPADEAAKALKASRATGIPAGAYDADYLKIFDTQSRQAAVAKIGVKYPQVATFLSNPDNAAVAVDDVDNLGALARTWDEAKRFALRAPTTMSSGLWGALSATTQTIAKYNPGAALQRAIFGSSVDDAIARYANQNAVEGRDIVQANQTQVKNFVGRNLIQGLDSTVTTATGIAVGVLTRNPEAALTIMGAQTGGSEFQKARDAGKGLEQSIFYGAQQGTIEALTEKIPASKLLGDLAAKTPFAKTLFNQLIREIPGEQAATFLQDMTEWANLHPEKTIGQFLEERPQAALETLIQTASGTIVQTSASKAVDVSIRVAGKVVGKVSAARHAQQVAEFLDQLADAAKTSKTRTRDPQAFESLVAALSADTGAENIYVPAEKVREYLQSTDWDSQEFWEEYDQDIADGTLSSGDVVIPISKAAAHLAGTPAWEALKGDMRLSAGGQSLNEAQATEAALPDEMERLGESVAGQLDEQQKADEPRQKLFEGIATKLTNAGNRLADARKQAEWVSSRYVSRALRLGREVTGNEFDNVEVNQVLPAGLAPIVARAPDKGLSEALKPVVEAMRGKQSPRSEKARSGPSLIDFIRSKGGIDDVGGDLDAIGFGKIKGVSKKGQTKLIRKSRGDVLASAGASMLGSDGQANSNSADELAMRAWEAGYFPEFSERPSVNDLLDALAEGNSGRHRFVASNENVTDTDQLRLAAQDLYQLLDQAGLDPDKATDKEIVGAIERYQEQASGRSFGQDLFGDPTSQDTRAMLERKAQERLHGKKAQKAPGSDGGLFDTRDTQADMEAQRSLFQGAPVATLKGDEIAPLTTHGKELRDAAKAWFKDNLSGTTIQSKALGREVHFGSSRKPISSSADERKLRLFAALPEIIGNAPLVDSQPPHDGSARTKAWHYLRGVAELDGEPISVTVSIREDDNGDFYYNHVLESPASLNSATLLAKQAMEQEGGAYDQSNTENGDNVNISLQSYSDGPRGRVTFTTDGKSVIYLFQEANASTFIHEMGHVWLEELQADASLPDAPQELKDDWQTVVDWFKANGHTITDGAIPTEAHELWARGIERFTMEGKAPSSALRKAFDAFRSWMVSIYHVVENLRSPITPEIRDVMARLIATDEEIAQAREEQNLKALFDSVESAAKFGMNEAAYKDYVKSASEAKDEAFDRLLFKTMESVRRQRTKEWQDERASVEADVRQGVDGRPVWRALAAVSAKGGVKLDKQSLIETYGEDILAQLPRYVPPIYAERGTDADSIAELNGFSTGDEMVKALIGVADRRAALKEGGDKRSARQSVIDEETDAIMKERYGDPLSDGSLQEEALAAIHNEKQGELQAIELRVLSARTSSPSKPTPYRIARLWAADKIRSGQVRDVASRSAIQRYLKAASKAGKAAEQAYMAGDTDEAFRQKQAQMLNNALVAEAKTAADEIDVAVARMSRLAKRRTIKSMDQDYLERIHDLLETVDLKPRSQSSIDRQGSFEAWRAEQEAKGHDIVTPPSFADSEGTTHWSRLSVEKLLGLDETIKQIAHLGRMKQTLLDGKERAEFDAIVAEFQGQAAMLPPKPPSDLMEPGFADRVKSGIASADAALLKIETLVDWLDGGDAKGVMNRIVFRPIAAAQDRENDMTADYTRRIVEAMQKGGTKRLKRWQERVKMPELLNRETGNPWVMRRQSLVSMALNMGNEGNIQRLTDGYGWNEASVREVLNRELTAEDWQFVQDVWDIIDTLWPEVSAMERRINGIEPDKVEAVPVETPHGTFRGGYYPAIYDTAKNAEAEFHSGTATDMFSTIYTKATTRASSTKDRANKVSRPILLQLGVINRHIGEVIHDITHREAVMQADKFLSSRRVMTAIDNTLGPEYRKQFRPWLQFVANQWAMERAGNEGIGKFINGLRANTTVVGMGFRITTVLNQIAGYSNSAEYVGAARMGEAIAKVSAQPVESFNFVMERSGEVRHRMDTLDRDLRTGLAQLQGKIGLRADVTRFAFHGIGYADRMVCIPTWIAGYNKALAAGASEQDAIYEADKAVRKSQGASSAKDLAAIQRGTGKWGELLRLMTMFYSYMSAYYQRERTLGRDIRGEVRARHVRNMPKLLARTFWLVALPPVLAELLSGRGPDDDEDWATWAFKNMLFNILGPIPGVRDMARPTWDALAGNQGFDYQFSPIVSAGKAVVNVGKDIHRVATGDDTKRATRDVLEAVGYFTGIVPGQIATSVQFLVDVGQGDQDPESVADWYTGLTKGKIPE